MEKVGIGILGLGAISGIYLKNLTELFKEVEIIGVYDLFQEKTDQVSREYEIPKAYSSMEDMFRDEDVEIVLNLTRPQDHYEAVSYTHLDVYKRQTNIPSIPLLPEGFVA